MEQGIKRNKFVELISKRKKLIAIIVASLLLVAIIVTTCVCCTANKVEGTYKFKRLYAYDNVYEVGERYQGETLTSDFIIVKVNSDHTVEILSKDYYGDRIRTEGIWYMTDENVVYVKSENISGNCYINDGTVIFTMGSATYILSK